MHRFYFNEADMYDNRIHICGSDVNHIRNVLRMKSGDRVVANDGSSMDYYCVIENIESDEVILSIEGSSISHAELGTKLYLFQALPKADKMELIVQKAVELGVHEIIPVMTSRCVVRLDERKQTKKIQRWQMIAESAAKQSERGIIPKVCKPLSFKNAIDYAKGLDYNIIPYERAEGMDLARKVMDNAAKQKSVGIFIGPEGGFSDEEIEYAASNGINAISLGNRILRTETAGLCVLSILMFKISE